ncbi:Membrane fusion protein of RND family multidrug efflux pump [Pseudoalteromonas luteoviolacea B = ATCC 29581]|nr:Membrane fusion protein of RND family multidrug efflux pump [Pseudoalteromonas luteoviolacea B = ATCC 29581]
MIVVVVVGAVALIQSMKPEPKKRGAPPTPAINVQAQTIRTDSFTFTLSSFGVVKPRTQSLLQSQVSGEVVWLSSQFREGGFFSRGDVLVRLDDRDYRAKVQTAKANVLSAEQTLVEEKARGEQALQDWARLGQANKAPSDLVLRKPQLAAAEAKLMSAQAELASAELALSRTIIKAPFDGRVLSKKVDLGQLAGNNTQLAEIYATDYVEVRLPLKQKDLPFVTLPEQYREGATKATEPVVYLESTLYGKPEQWQGRIVRTESAIDSNAQQLYVIAQIDDPFSQQHQNKLPLKIGQYVTAKITGNTLAAQIRIANKALYQNSYVFVVKEGTLQRRDLTLAWQNDTHSVVAKGLENDDVLIVSPLGQVVSGTKVNVVELDGQAVEVKSKRRERQDDGNIKSRSQTTQGGQS